MLSDNMLILIRGIRVNQRLIYFLQPVQFVLICMGGTPWPHQMISP